MSKDKISQKAPAAVARTSNLGELISRYPQTAEILLDWGLHCVGCGAVHMDTVEAGARLHGLSDKEIDDLVERLNEALEFKE